MKGRTPLPTSALSRTPKKKAAVSASTSASAPSILSVILASLDNMKAEDTVTIDLTGKSSIADEVVKDLHEAGVTRVRLEGQRVGDWVLIDAGDVIVHVFRPEIRIFYNLEKMWSGRAGDTRSAN